MANMGRTFKRCGCRNGRGQRLEQHCSRLAERGHGSWYFHCSAPNVLGRSERIRRGGYSPQATARAARDEYLADNAARRSGEGWTVERWLRHWLETRSRIRPTTRLHYTRSVELVLIPYLGHYRLADLDGPLLRAVFAEIARTTNSKGRPQSPSALNHLRTTLRAALNLAVREEADRLEPGPAHRDQRLPQTSRPGLDRQPRRCAGTDRRTPVRGGMDRHAAQQLPGQRGRRLAVRLVVARSPARATPR